MSKTMNGRNKGERVEEKMHVKKKGQEMVETVQAQ